MRGGGGAASSCKPKSASLALRVIFLQEFDVVELLSEFVVCGDLEKVGVHAAYGVEYCCVNADGHCCGTFFHRSYRCTADARPFGSKRDRNFTTHASQTDLFSHLFKDFTGFRQ